MGKKALLLLPFCLLAAAAVWAAAVGDAADPLVSMSYLNGPFTEIVDAAADRQLDAASSLFAVPAVTPSAAPAVSGWMEACLKEGDLLLANTGDSVLLLAGSGQVTYPSGAVVDVTEGAVLPSGGAVQPRHRYLVAEDTAASFLVTSKTAVADCQGTCTFRYSTSVDYNTMASALKALHLFQGSLTGYGQGFDLEAAPTRLQALIMFIRVLGEEQEALAWTGVQPFEDVQPGSQGEKYVGYAFQQGYTNGYSATQFRPSSPVSAQQYTEFILRALGYSSAANTNLSDTLERALAAGLLTAGEAAMLQNGTFQRADLVYISYYALDVLLPGGGRTLADVLMEKGVFTQWERDSAPQAASWRL